MVRIAVGTRMLIVPQLARHFNAGTLILHTSSGVSNKRVGTGAKRVSATERDGPPVDFLRTNIKLNKHLTHGRVHVKVVPTPP